MSSIPKTFLSFSFGCRVNAAETNQWSQIVLDQGFLPATNQDKPSIILINTCSITKKGEKESLNKVKLLSQKYPKAKIYVTGCADFTKIKNLKNISFFTNQDKEKLLKNLNSLYSPKIKDKFSRTKRFLLKIQSGCTQYCSYCIVPFKRNYLYSLPINQAINTVKQAIKDGYREVIITGVNIDQYQYKFTSLLKDILDKTSIELISFGSVPINCIDNHLIKLYQTYPDRLSKFIHIPIQSGSDKILKLMNRPYTKKDILTKIHHLKSTIKDINLGTDIIVGFPSETKSDFNQTLQLCHQIGFSKIHTFIFSPRPGTKARILFENSPKIKKEILKNRSLQIRLAQNQKKLSSKINFHLIKHQKFK
jgi:threonylcarbamoyladenosine tRNA methylthiotransferase MtaB